MADRRAGANPILNHGQLLNNGPMLLEEELAPPVIVPPCTLQAQVLAATDLLLTYNASISIPPTRASRIQYLFFQGLASAFHWVSPAIAIQGTKDSWNWNTKAPLASETDQAVFLTQALNVVLSKLIGSSYSPSSLNSNLNPDQLLSVESIKTRGSFSTWQSLWEAWYANRQTDGFIAASAFPDPSTLPNGPTFLEVTQTQDFTDSVAYPNPLQWTPLSINGSQKKYLTATWNDVRSTCLTTEQETSIKTTAANQLLTGPARSAEIEALLSLSENLTSSQKIIAEFWAGGPGTASPPGIAIWLWRNAAPTLAATTYQLIYSGFELAIGIFETSRLIWGLKYQFKEARPIQEIRRAFNGQQVTKYDGTQMNANLWVPFQMPNFVTPPFPDFPSGHSGFSQTLANIMTTWFGSNLPSQQITTTTAKVVAGFLPQTYTFSLTQFPIQQGVSEIQPGQIPNQPTTLAFTTWQTMANSAGLSRQFGGIHAQSAHLGSQVVSDALTPLIRTEWNIQLQ